MSRDAANVALSSKYNSADEGQVILWIEKLVGDKLTPGMQEMKRQLSDGKTLMKLVKAVYDGTPTLPPKAEKYKKKLEKINNGPSAFQKMENIGKYLEASSHYGVEETGLFQTVDLYEGHNMSQVINSITQLGTMAQKNNFNGMTIGPKPSEENKREFSDEQLQAGKCIIGLQAGSNKGASQSGMAIGSTRHISDIKVDDMCADGHGVIGLQAGTNQGASQKGMNIGGTRHINDLKCQEMCQEGHGVIGLQAGTNQMASQKGMNIGNTRHIVD